MLGTQVRAILYAAGWAVAVWLALQLSIVALLTVAPNAGTDIVSLGAVHVLVLGAACYLLAWTSDRSSLLSSDLRQWAQTFGLHKPQASVLAIGVAVGVLAKLPADGLRALIEYYYPTGELEVIEQMRLLRHDTVGQTLALFLIVGFSGPLLEELLYRGLLFRQLALRAGLMTAWLVTSVVFALSHASIRDWPSLVLVALAFGFLRGVFGTVWASLGAHVAFNSATLGALVFGLQDVDTTTPFPVPLALGGAVAVVVLLLLARNMDNSGST